MLINARAPKAAWPSVSDLAEPVVGISLSAFSRFLAALGIRTEKLGRESKLSPTDAVIALEARGIPAEVAESEVDKIVEMRIARIPALAKGGASRPSQEIVEQGRPQRSVAFREQARPRRLYFPRQKRRVPTREEMDRRLAGRHLDLESVIYHR
jgi:hypothetical protein